MAVDPAHAADNNLLAELRARLASLERELHGIPSEPARDEQHALLSIIDGSTLNATPTYGVAKYLGTLTELASDYDPDVSTTPGTFTGEAGVGRALLYIDGVAQAEPVLVLLDNSSQITTARVQGNFVRTYRTKALPVSGDPTNIKTLWIPEW